MAEKEYIKLTPARQRAGLAILSVSRSRLWLGKDHLLLVTTDGYTETYKRFYFRDIQALFIRGTERQTIIGAVTGLLTALFVAIGIGASAIELRWTFGVLAATCAIPFLMNLVYGPTCACQLRTAVQTEDLPSLSRVRRARKVFARIRPLIAAAQGELNPEEIPSRMRESVLQPAAPPQPAFPAAPSDGPGAPPFIS